MAKRQPKTSKPESRQLTKAEFDELRLCHPSNGLDGFLRFLSHCKMQDKESGREIPFDPWGCQRELASMLVGGDWVITLKARQLGITWIIAAYCLWKLLFIRFFTVVLVNQGLDYAKEFVMLKVRFVYDRLPEFMKVPILSDTKTFLRFGTEGANCHGSELHAVAGNADAGRSKTANLAIYDEAAFVEWLEECRNGIEPTLGQHGQAIMISTSNGPSGPFAKEYKAARKGTSKFKKIFFPWSAHPKRDKAWYEAERLKHLDDPNYMRREYPSTEDEAFEAAGGRIYPWFGAATHELKLTEFSPAWRRFRGLDWGESHSAFAALWCVAIPSDKPKLTYEPGLTWFHDEMQAYAWKEDADEPRHEHSHIPDALRMIVCSYFPDGECHDGQPVHLHIYRELYVEDPVGKGHTSQTLIAKIKEMSGWKLMEQAGKMVWAREPWCEQYEATVFDRSRPMLENEFAQFGEYAEPHWINTRENVTRKEEVRAGIIMVNKLVVGALPARVFEGLTPAAERQQLELAPNVMAEAGLTSSRPIVQVIRSNAARRKRREAMRRRRHPYLGAI